MKTSTLIIFSAEDIKELDRRWDSKDLFNEINEQLKRQYGNSSKIIW